jgi:hypothetical protein
VIGQAAAITGWPLAFEHHRAVDQAAVEKQQ